MYAIEYIKKSDYVRILQRNCMKILKMDLLVSNCIFIAKVSIEKNFIGGRNKNMKEIFNINSIEILKSSYIDKCIDTQNDVEILDINYTN